MIQSVAAPGRLFVKSCKVLRRPNPCLAFDLIPDIHAGMRVPVIVTGLGLIGVVLLSLTVRDPFSVGLFSAVLAAGCAGFLMLHVKSGGKSRLPLLLAGPLLMVAIGLTNAPLKMSFALVEPQFESLSQQLVHEERPDFPLWIGPFRLTDGGVRKGGDAAYLMTNRDIHEINGFFRDPEGRNFNLWSIVPLGNRWAYVEED